ncbi:hypothetical protein CBF29_00170 [Vagococcus elongatus]|uniref:DUF2179 domain-containing protein n=1 Tax=Vagococcus elongatus TaxID=180344 RepID=A0A430B629_9ENTE|nr:hypothetical protein CBF29_00170 [Vagococcus elongatus]
MREFNQNYEIVTRCVVILINALLAAIGLNLFLIPANVFSAGLNGVSQLLSEALNIFSGITVDTGILVFLLNIPVFMLGWIKLGPKATIYSFLTVFSFSISLLLIPVHAIVEDTLLNAIVGGVLVGIGAALCLKFGFTTGGFDVLSVIIAKSTGKSVGNMMFLMNLLIIMLAGLLFNWEQAIYTVISIYCLSIVVDKIHTSGNKLTLMIISDIPEDNMVQQLRKTVVRGITIFPGKGGISKKERSVYMIVVSRYELYDIEKAIYEVDPHAFVNVMPTEHVMGLFYTENQQKEMLRNAYGQVE